MDIQITEKYKAKVIPNNYQLVEWVEGGKEVRNVATGEMQIQESKWKLLDVYYANLPALVRHVARLSADENGSDLDEWLNEFTIVINEFETRQQNVKEI